MSQRSTSPGAATRDSQVRDDSKSSASINIPGLGNANFDELFKRADTFLERYKIVVALSQSTQIAKPWIALGLCFIAFTFVMMTFGADGLCNLFGFLYPARRTLLALRSLQPDVNELRFLLQYWFVFGAFVVFESFFDAFLRWVTMYFWLKVAFLAYCFLPQFRGAELVVQRVLEPSYEWLQRHFDNLTASEQSEIRAHHEQQQHQHRQ